MTLPNPVQLAIPAFIVLMVVELLLGRFRIARQDRIDNFQMLMRTRFEA